MSSVLCDFYNPPCRQARVLKAARCRGIRRIRPIRLPVRRKQAPAHRLPSCPCMAHCFAQRIRSKEADRRNQISGDISSPLFSGYCFLRKHCSGSPAGFLTCSSCAFRAFSRMFIIRNGTCERLAVHSDRIVRDFHPLPFYPCGTGGPCMYIDILSIRLCFVKCEFIMKTGFFFKQQDSYSFDINTVSMRFPAA